MEQNDLDSAHACLATAERYGLQGTANSKVLWSLIEIESLPEDGPDDDMATDAATGGAEAVQDAAVAAQRKQIGQTLIQGSTGAHWLLRRRAQRFLA